MKSLLRSLLLLACFAGFSSSAMAAGLVQVSLAGRIEQDKGSIIALQVTGGTHSFQFSGMVGEGTTVGDLAALFELKLKRSGFSVTRGDVVAARGPVSLFIDNVETIVVRMGGGVTATVTSTEEMPTSFRALPPRMKSNYGGGSLQAYVTMEDEAEGQEPSLEIQKLAVELPSTGGSSVEIATSLGRKALHLGMVSTVKDDGGWCATGTDSGAKAVGMSVKLYSDADWGIEMTLAPLVGSR